MYSACPAAAVYPPWKSTCRTCSVTGLKRNESAIPRSPSDGVHPFTDS